MPTIIPFPEPPVTGVRASAHDPVRAAYDSLAPAYDAFTAGCRHDLWLEAIERVARAHGLRGRRVLDVACGTGKSFLPLLERGYAITACDLSPEMAARASRKAPRARVLVADARRLPALGNFDLVTCLDDVLNSLLTRAELAAALAGLARQLAPGGLAIWDVNTLATVRATFSSDRLADRGEWFVAWHGTAPADVAAGAVVEARVDAFRRRGATWTRATSHLRQRHWALAEITRHAHDAGLHVEQVLGQHRGARLEDGADEQTHVKALFVARRG